LLRHIDLRWRETTANRRIDNHHAVDIISQPVEGHRLRCLVSSAFRLMLEANDTVGGGCELDGGRPLLDGNVHRRSAVNVRSVLMSLLRCPGRRPAETNATHHTIYDGQRISAGGHLPSL
jgi:hypothetical protein